MTKSNDKTLDQVLQDIEKQFGKGSVMKLGSNEVRQIDVIPSGSIALDMILGIGGYPKGRIIEIYGPESSGKTTFALHAIAEAQKLGGRVAFIDAENSLEDYKQKYGSDAYGFTAYVLNLIRIYSIPFCFLGIVVSAIYQYVIGIRKLDIQEKGLVLMVTFVTILVICQILPLAFAIVVKFGRG